MNQRKDAPIGVFDSGVGGLTVAREIMRNLPSEKIVYFGDTARVPYGSKSRETVIRYSRQIVRFLKTQEVKAIVVACNTASALALETIQQETDILHYHLLCFRCYLKGMHVPAPVPVKKNTVRKFIFQNLAGGSFSNSHRSAYQVDIFHSLLIPTFPIPSSSLHSVLLIPKTPVSNTDKFLHISFSIV